MPYSCDGCEHLQEFTVSGLSVAMVDFVASVHLSDPESPIHISRADENLLENPFSRSEFVAFVDRELFQVLKDASQEKNDLVFGADQIGRSE